MREGYTDGKMKPLAAALSILAILAFVTFNAAAQGGDGRSENLPGKRAVRKPAKRPVRASKKTAPPKPTPAPKTLDPHLGALSAVINEGGSRVYLSSPMNPEPVLVLTTPRQRSTFWRMLPAGRYLLSIRKAGFFDEVRTVDVAARGSHRLSINLRPELAMLSVGTNLADVEIDIERAGKFQGSVKKHLIKPGKYKINFKRRGYIPQTLTADLSIAGKEQNIYVVLKPLPIDTLLAQADEHLAKGQLDAALPLVDDVLLLNPAHARANLAKGSIELKRGAPTAADHFLKAINGGETLLMPVKTIVDDILTNVQIAIDRDSVAFRSTSRVDLNFRITRRNLDEMFRSASGSASTFVAVRGESDFFGRSIRPNMKIFSVLAEIDPVSKDIVCGQRISCVAEIDTLFKVLTEWRVMGTPAANNRTAR